MFGKKGKSKGGKAGAEFFDTDKRDLAEQFEGSVTNKYVVIVKLQDELPRRSKILYCRINKSKKHAWETGDYCEMEIMMCFCFL